MDTKRLEQSSRLLDSISWSAVASGTVIALALQTLLLMLGYAIATSVGDHAPGAGFGVWMVIVELCAIAVGAALTARLSHVYQKTYGMAAGIMTWALAIVLGAVFQGLTLTRAFGGPSPWAPFFGAAISLAAAIIGGAFGSRIGSSSSRGDEYHEPTEATPAMTAH